MSIKKLIEEALNERMTESEKINKINKFFENGEATELLHELKQLDLLENNYTNIIDMGWDRYRISIYRDLSMNIDRFDETHVVGEPLNKNPWRPQMLTTFDGNVSTVTLVEPNASVKDILDVLKIAFFGEN